MTDDGVQRDRFGDEVGDRLPSDWDEQDLLTIDEASERLVEEIAELKEAIAAEADEVVRARQERRRAALEASLTSITSGPTDLARA